MLNKKGMRFVFFTAQNLRINPQLPLHSVHRRWLLHTHSRLIIIRTYCEFVLGSCGFKFAHFSCHAQSSGIANNNRPIRSISYTNARKSAYKKQKQQQQKATRNCLAVREWAASKTAPLVGHLMLLVALSLCHSFHIVRVSFWPLLLARVGQAIQRSSNC